jgi:bifunctional pyridoxal-dependent enzyme with beta-cystathionase and maltose regulon repressor activities
VDFDEISIERLRARRGEKWATYPDDVLPAWVADIAQPLRDYVAELREPHWKGPREPGRIAGTVRFVL